MSEGDVPEVLPVCPGVSCGGCSSWDCEYYELLAPVFSDATEVVRKNNGKGERT